VGLLFGRAALEPDAPHSVLDVGISAEMEHKMAEYIAAGMEQDGLWESDFRSPIARPLGSTAYLGPRAAALRVSSARTLSGTLVAGQTPSVPPSNIPSCLLTALAGPGMWRRAVFRSHPSAVPGNHRDPAAALRVHAGSACSRHGDPACMAWQEGLAAANGRPHPIRVQVRLRVTLWLDLHAR
jgi:hypothetical protein